MDHVLRCTVPRDNGSGSPINLFYTISYISSVRLLFYQLYRFKISKGKSRRKSQRNEVIEEDCINFTVMHSHSCPCEVDNLHIYPLDELYPFLLRTHLVLENIHLKVPVLFEVRSPQSYNLGSNKLNPTATQNIMLLLLSPLHAILKLKFSKLNHDTPTRSKLEISFEF
jgi:hypothetical protein